MHKPAPPSSTPPAVTRVPNQLLACAVSGLGLGQVVLGLARQHDGALTGLVCALVFVVCGGASLLLGLLHLHATQQPQTQPRGQARRRAPVLAWTLAMAASLLVSLHWGSLQLA